MVIYADHTERDVFAVYPLGFMAKRGKHLSQAMH